jgi:hypothetical protein
VFLTDNAAGALCGTVGGMEFRVVEMDGEIIVGNDDLPSTTGLISLTRSWFSKVARKQRTTPCLPEHG